MLGYYLDTTWILLGYLLHTIHICCVTSCSAATEGTGTSPPMSAWRCCVSSPTTAWSTGAQTPGYVRGKGGTPPHNDVMSLLPHPPREWRRLGGSSWSGCPSYTGGCGAQAICSLHAFNAPTPSLLVIAGTSPWGSWSRSHRGSTSVPLTSWAEMSWRH